jgi:predicted nucleic acid-binding protein
LLTRLSCRPASVFLARHRSQPLLTTVISAGEIAMVFDSTAEARSFLTPYRILRLTSEIAYLAAEIHREMAQRLGENDNWIAGFCRYYRQPLISRDVAFDRVQGLRRLAY